MTVRTSLVLSFIALRRHHGGAILLATRRLRLCAFRSRSRNTSGFEPLKSFDLPPQEFLAAAEAEEAGQPPSVRLRRTRGSDAFRWVESTLSDDELAEKAFRCVLLHGLFDVWGHGRDQEEAIADAAKAKSVPEHCVEALSWSVGVTRYGQSNLSREEKLQLAGGSIEDFLSRTLSGSRTDAASAAIRIRIIEDACPDLAASVPPHLRRKPRGADLQREKRFYICRELQMGLGVGGATDMGTACRRPGRGVLKELALSNRRTRAPTAIDPEIGLIMANLAKIRPGSFVLDPFCGAASLLLPAAYMGATVWGSDIAGPATAGCGALASSRIAREECEGVREDFLSLRLPTPTLAAADIADRNSPFRKADFYDAIITDPPYNIKEQAVATTANTTFHSETLAQHAGAHRDDTLCAGGLEGHAWVQAWVEAKALDGKDTSGEAAVATANGLVGGVVWSLLSLARFALKPGGRLCFFLPLRGAEARLDALPLAVASKLVEPDASGRRLSRVYESKQRMKSPNMCRWLIVLERTADALARKDRIKS